MTTLSASLFVEDFDVYPRLAVDSSHVSEIARAIEAGIKMPPIVAQTKTNRIIDGWHRRRAYVRVSGLQAEVPVEFKTYSSEQKLIEDAIYRNSSHGRKLDQQDRTRCALLLKKHGVSAKKIAITLSTTESRIEQILVRIAVVDDEEVPVKPIAWPKNKEPRKLTPEQYEIARSSSGWNPKQTITQLTNELLADVIDVSDEELVKKLWLLHDAIATRAPRLHERTQ